MRRLSLFVFITTLVGCAAPGEPITLTDAQRQAARSGVVAMLRDPDSARFGGIYGARRPDGSILVCGYVNARNGFGGYTGMSPFSGYFSKGGPTFTFEDVATPDGDGVATVNACRLRGVPI